MWGCLDVRMWGYSEVIGGPIQSSHPNILTSPHPSILPAPHLLQPRHRPPQVRNDDTAAHHQSDREDVMELLVGDTFLGAANDVVGNTVVAPEHQRGHEDQPFLRFCSKGAGVGCPLI